MGHEPTEMLQPLTHPYLDEEGGGGVEWELTPGAPGLLLTKLVLIFTSPASVLEPFPSEVGAFPGGPRSPLLHPAHCSLHSHIAQMLLLLSPLKYTRRVAHSPRPSFLSFSSDRELIL